MKNIYLSAFLLLLASSNSFGAPPPGLTCLNGQLPNQVTKIEYSENEKTFQTLEAYHCDDIAFIRPLNSSSILIRPARGQSAVRLSIDDEIVELTFLELPSFGSPDMRFDLMEYKGRLRKILSAISTAPTLVTVADRNCSGRFLIEAKPKGDIVRRILTLGDSANCASQVDVLPAPLPDSFEAKISNTTYRP